MSLPRCGYRALSENDALFRYAKKRKYVKHNVVADLRGPDTLPRAKVKHHAAITDPAGDALFKPLGGTNVPGADLTHVQLSMSASTLHARMTVAGSGLVTPALVGAALLTIVPSNVGGAGSENRNIAFGLAAMAVAAIATGRFGLQGKLQAATAAAGKLRQRHPSRARSGDIGWRSPLGVRRGEVSP